MSELQKLEDNIRILKSRVEQEKKRADYWKSRALKADIDEIIHIQDGYKICSRRASCINKNGSDGVLSCSEFYKDRRTVDGLQYYCKPCLLAAQKPEDAKKRNTRVKNWHKTKIGKESIRRGNKKARGTTKKKAHGAVAHAVRGGKLKRVSDGNLNCEYCGGRAWVYHHYLGYDKVNWLHVVPVCRKCNNQKIPISSHA